MPRKPRTKEQADAARRPPGTQPRDRRPQRASPSVSVPALAVDHNTAAEMLGIGPRKLQQLVADGHIQKLVSPVKKRLYAVSELTRYIERCQSRSATPERNQTP